MRPPEGKPSISGEKAEAERIETVHQKEIKQGA